MIENVLSRKQLSVGKKIGVKTALSALVIIAAVCLPRLVHLVAGAQGGVKYLPMYLPVIIGGALMGAKWGFTVGLIAPFMSFLVTSAFGNPMPMAERLPFMMAELAVFALVSGAFGKLIYKNKWMAFPAVLSAEIAGRASFVLLIAIFGRFTSFTVPMIWGQIKTGFVGLALQAVIAPLLIIGMRKLIKNDETGK